MYKQTILNHLVDYLKKKEISFKKTGKVVMLQCPFCKAEPFTANIIPNTSVVNCFKCDKKYNLMDIVKHVEGKTNEEEIFQYLKELLDIKTMTKKDENEIQLMLDFYEENGFDLVPIAVKCPFCFGKKCSKCDNTGNYGKNPIEKDWTNKSHKNKDEWLNWITNGLNIGVKTGTKSGITVIDIDQKPIPEEVRQLVKNVLIQETKNGFHLFFKYDKDLPKTRINDFKIDIENDGGQVVVFPSTTSLVGRKFLNSEKIVEMPSALKKLLLSKIDLPNLRTNSEKIRDDIKTEDFKINPKDFQLKNNNLEGVCNSSFIKLGGILRKELNLKQTEFVLNIFNNHLLETPMEQKSIRSMIRELDRYIKFDEEELAAKVLQYLRDAEDATRTDVERALDEKKIRIDKVLNYLVREGYLIKRGRNYHIIKKAEWSESLIDIGKPVPFKMPYFHDVANFNWGDLLLIGSKAKFGKTHISMNIVKDLVKQGIKPYYISLETGSRFARIALQLGLKEGDFYHTFCADPTKIELEKDAVTIIDWLLIIDKAKTDLVFRHFIEQLNKTNGFLVIFQQLKADGTWFAPNMCNQFPALATRYLYTDENSGTYGEYLIDVIREQKPFGKKMFKIPCKYNWQTKELIRIDELKENE